MGEETFGSVDHMNDEQLGNKKLWWAKQVSSPFIDTHHTPHTHTHTTWLA
jgi:hypothetical protein